MSAAQDGRARAIEAAHRDFTSRRYWTQSPGGRPVMNLVDAHDVAEAAIDAALADGGVVTRDDRVQCGGIAVCRSCTDEYDRVRERAERAEADRDFCHQKLRVTRLTHGTCSTCQHALDQERTP